MLFAWKRNHISILPKILPWFYHSASMSNIRCYMEEEKLQFNIFYKTVNWVSSKKFHTTNSFSQNVTFVFTKKGTYLPIQNNVKQNFLQHCLRTKLLKMFQSVFYLLKIAIHNVMKTNKNCWFFSSWQDQSITIQKNLSALWVQRWIIWIALYSSALHELMA